MVKTILVNSGHCTKYCVLLLTWLDCFSQIQAVYWILQECSPQTIRHTSLLLLCHSSSNGCTLIAGYPLKTAVSPTISKQLSLTMHFALSCAAACTLFQLYLMPAVRISSPILFPSIHLSFFLFLFDLLTWFFQSSLDNSVCAIDYNLFSLHTLIYAFYIIVKSWQCSNQAINYKVFNMHSKTDREPV